MSKNFFLYVIQFNLLTDMIGSSGLSVLLVLALCLFNDGYRLDNSGTARERLELAKRILAEVPLIDG